MSVAELSISLNNSFDLIRGQSGSYKCGETITGSVILKVVSSGGLCQHDGIVLTVEGAGDFRWSGQNQDGGEDIISHQYKNKYLSIEKVLTREDLPVGCYEFPFEFTLPHNLPASFFASETDGSIQYYGEIFYEIRARMKRSFKFNPEASVQFQIDGEDQGIVKGHCPGQDCPKNTVTFKNIRTGFGNISVVFNCPQKELTPGSIVQFSTSFCNNSLKRILSTAVNLVQCTRYYGMDGNLRNLKVKKIFSLFGPSVEIGKVGVMTAQQHIPVDTPPPLSKSKGRILDISYYFLINVNVMDCGPLSIIIPTHNMEDIGNNNNNNSLVKIQGTSKFPYSDSQTAVMQR